MPDHAEVNPTLLRRSGQQLLNCLFRVRLNPDIHERAADFGIRIPPGPKRRFRLARIAARRLLFVHVPKNAGTSISEALYGTQIGHSSIRFYKANVRELAETLPSFAIVRNPEERFMSAYRHAVAGRAADVEIDRAFHEFYRGFRSIDDALDHLQNAKSPYEIDNIFRPQSWYLTDMSGKLAVDTLIPFEHLSLLPRHIPELRSAIPHLNRSRSLNSALNAEQRLRLRHIYSADWTLMNAAQNFVVEDQSNANQPALRLSAALC